MEKYKLYKDLKVENALLYFFVFLCIYIGRDTLVTTTLLGHLLSQTILVFIFLVCMICFFATNKENYIKILKDIRVKVLIITSIFILGFMVINNDFTLRYFSILFCIYISFFLNFIVDYKKLLTMFVKIMFFLCIYSLISTYFFKPLFLNGFLTFPTFKNSMDFEFINCFFSFSPIIPTYIRNFGIFREPGVYQFYILISLISTIFILEKNKYFIPRLIVFTITMVSTFSTVGIIEYVFLIIISIIFYRKYFFNNNFFLVFSLIFIIGFILYISYNSDLYWTVYSMFYKLKDTFSFNDARSLSIINNIKMFIESPIIGQPLNNVIVGNNTSTTTIIAAVFGTLGLVIHIYSWGVLYFATVLYNNKKKITNIIYFIGLIIIIFASINTQNLITNNFFYIIPICIMFDTLTKQRELIISFQKKRGG